MKWELKKLGEIATFSQGIQVGLEKQLTIPKEGYVRFIRIVDYTQNTDDLRYVENPGEKYFVSEDDIVMVRYGTPGLIGRGKKGVIANNLFKIKITNNIIINDYLALFLSQYKIQNYLRTQGSATMPALNFGQLKTVDIFFPKSLEEQQTIVAKLDQAFAAIDQAKANIEKNIANAKELFQSKLNQIFSQKGEGWEEKRIKEIGKVQTGTTPPTKDKDNYGEFIPFIKPAHFNSDGSLTPLDSYLSEKGIKKSRLIEANSVLMVCIGATIGKTGFTEIDITCNQQINAVTPSKNYNYKFIYFGMISRIFQDEVLENGKGAQATLPIINKSKWENLFLNVNPNKDAQQQIVTQLDQLQEQTNLLVTKYHQKLANLEELRKSILEKAFKGELS